MISEKKKKLCFKHSTCNAVDVAVNDDVVIVVFIA